MITIDQAKALTTGTILYHITARNADGTAQRWRVSGRPIVWKTRPGDVRVPVKHGLYHYGEFWQYDLDLVSSPDKGAYDVLVLAVAHDEFRELGEQGIREFGKADSLLYDIKYLLPIDGSDDRL